MLWRKGFGRSCKAQYHATQVGSGLLVLLSSTTPTQHHASSTSDSYKMSTTQTLCMHVHLPLTQSLTYNYFIHQHTFTIFMHPLFHPYGILILYTSMQCTDHLCFCLSVRHHVWYVNMFDLFHSLCHWIIMISPVLIDFQTLLVHYLTLLLVVGAFLTAAAEWVIRYTWGESLGNHHVTWRFLHVYLTC
jgi:hypothetical protein